MVQPRVTLKVQSASQLEEGGKGFRVTRQYSFDTSKKKKKNMYVMHLGSLGTGNKKKSARTDRGVAESNSQSPKCITT